MLSEELQLSLKSMNASDTIRLFLFVTEINSTLKQNNPTRYKSLKYSVLNPEKNVIHSRKVREKKKLALINETVIIE